MWQSCDQLTSEHSQKPWDGIKLLIRNNIKSLNFKTYVREKPNTVESVKNHRIMVCYELRENCQILYTKQKSHENHMMTSRPCMTGELSLRKKFAKYLSMKAQREE